jgi:hypothetical protein
VTPLSLNQLLMLYTWFPLAALLFFMLLIGRFFEKFSGERTFFRLFIVPMFFFGAAAVRYTSINLVSGDLLGAMLLTAGGLMLIWLCAILYRRMLLRELHDHEHGE